MQRKIRFGILGCADIANRRMIPAMLALNKEIELVAISSRSTDKLDLFTRKFGISGVLGYNNLLENKEIDVVYLPLPAGLHEEWIMKCLDHGKHVLVEKSFSLNLSSTERILRYAEARNLLVFESFNFISHRRSQYFKSLVDDQRIGEMRLFRSQFGFPPLSRDNYRYNSKIGGGALLDAAAYNIKAACWLFAGQWKIHSSIINFKDGIDIFGHITMLNDAGVCAQLSYGFDNYYRNNYEIWGENGYLFSDKVFSPKANEETTIILESKFMDKETITFEGEDQFQSIILLFLKILKSDDFIENNEAILMQSSLLTESIQNALRIE